MCLILLNNKLNQTHNFFGRCTKGLVQVLTMDKKTWCNVCLLISSHGFADYWLRGFLCCFEFWIFNKWELVFPLSLQFWFLCLIGWVLVSCLAVLVNSNFWLSSTVRLLSCLPKPIPEPGSAVGFFLLKESFYSVLAHSGLFDCWGLISIIVGSFPYNTMLLEATAVVICCKINQIE